MDLNYKAIGKRIKISRIKAEMTQEHLSALVDISPSHMSNIETGTTRVSLTTIVNIANALSVTTDDLLCDSVIHAKSQFEDELKGILDSCDDYEMRVICQSAKSILEALRDNKRLIVSDNDSGI